MRDRPRDKMRQRSHDKTTVCDDFTEILGVPEFAVRSLYNHGILSFGELWAADLRWLHGPVRAAIERWRNG